MRNPCPCGKSHVDVEQCEKLEIAHRALGLYIRLREVEKTRDEMQRTRDEALEAARQAENAVVTLAQRTPPGVQLEISRPEAGSFVILRVEEFKDEAERDAMKYAVMYLQRKHRDLTLLLSHHGKAIAIEGLDQKAMRAKGWVRLEKSAAILASALREHRYAVTAAQEIFSDMNAATPLEAMSRRIHDWQHKAAGLLGQPVPVTPISTEGGLA